jgi:hypothetical protein
MTHDISKHPYWSSEEFIAFVLLYAAEADMECTDEERAYIKTGIDDAHLDVVEATYTKLSDFERISVIKSYHPQYFATPEQKSELLKKVEGLFQADGEFDILEHNMYRMLQKIL